MGDLYRIYRVCRRDDVDVNLASIPESFSTPLRYSFDPEYMKALFQVGYEMGKVGYPWARVPPGFGGANTGSGSTAQPQAAPAAGE